MSFEEAFANAEDKGRISAREFLDKMLTEYEWHILHNPVSHEFLELYIDEPEGLNHYLPPDFLEMTLEDLNMFFDEFNTICANTMHFYPGIKGPIAREPDLDGNTPEP